MSKTQNGVLRPLPSMLAAGTKAEGGAFNIISAWRGAPPPPSLSIHPARPNPSHQDTRHGTEVDLWLIVVYSQCPGGNGREESQFHLWRADVDLPFRLCHRKGLAGITLALMTSL